MPRGSHERAAQLASKVNGKRNQVPHPFVPAGHVAHNLALVRHIALNLIRLNTSRKASVTSERLPAATSDEYRVDLLGVESEEDKDD